MRHAVIMAGGAGTRLWPLSRQGRPRQVLKLFGGKSLIRESYERAASWLEPEAICVITNEAHLPMLAKELPEIPPANLFGEPVGRDTVNAVGLSAAIIGQRDPEATIGVFTADHIIKPIDRFRAAVETAFAAAEKNVGALVTMGITPSRPDTNYGYVQRGDRVSDGVFEVKQFAEKPNLESAMEYVGSGEYYWNSGMFVWRAAAVLSQIQKHLPEAYGPLCKLGAAWDGEDCAEMLGRVYPELPKISVDYAVMERADKVLVVEMDCNWIDVGSWPAMESVVVPDGEENVSVCRNVVHLSSRGNIVVSEDDHLITTIGVKDLVIAHSADATLVCSKDDTVRIKELVARLKDNYGDKYI